MFVTAINRKIGCTPLEVVAVQTVKAAGMKMVVNRQRVAKLTVVFANPAEDLLAGDAVYVKGASFNAQWAKDVFEFGDPAVPFIMVPLDQIELVERAPRLVPQFPPASMPTSVCSLPHNT